MRIFFVNTPLLYTLLFVTMSITNIFAQGIPWVNSTPQEEQSTNGSIFCPGEGGIALDCNTYTCDGKTFILVATYTDQSGMEVMETIFTETTDPLDFQGFSAYYESGSYSTDIEYQIKQVSYNGSIMMGGDTSDPITLSNTYHKPINFKVTTNIEKCPPSGSEINSIV